ncbi:MAG: hypothetical protein C0501_02865 [Isosphaera sp.]|nr:hypothetical protein [Isosphaera sp.]
MPRRLVATAFLLVPLALAPAAPVPEHLMKPPPYHPTRVGATWVYQQGTELLTYTVSASAEEVGGAAVTVVRVDGDRKSPHQKVLVSSAGVTRTEYLETPFDGPDDLVRVPVRVGDRWETKVTGRRDRGDGRSDPELTLTAKRTVAKVERVEVPAGVFRAVRIDGELTYNGRSYRATSWYAPHVGLVKLDQEEWSRVLKSFDPGKD